MKIELIGPEGEPVNFIRCLRSHGLADLPPFFVNAIEPSLTFTMSVGKSVRTVKVKPEGDRFALIGCRGKQPGRGMSPAILREVRYVLRMDEDLSSFYNLISKDARLSWATAGAGRLIRSQTVFEDVVKTICTTNCSWNYTVKMVSSLVENLGRPAPGAPKNSPLGRAFPSADAMANASLSFYRDVIRAGYRGRYLKELAESVAAGSVDLELARFDHPSQMEDDQVEKMLLSLPGVGRYGASHIMMLAGRYSRLVLDSWTRPTYSRLSKRLNISDEDILNEFSAYGSYAGLAFWLFLTKDWAA